MKYDYRKAELWYIRHKGSTLKSCAERYKIPLSSLIKKASAGKWNEKKKKYCNEVVTMAKDKSVEADADALAAAAKTAEQAVKLIEKTIGEKKQFNKYIVSETDALGRTNSVEKEFEKVDMRAFRDCVAALKDLISILRNAKGIPTQAETFYQDIQRQKLELEKKKSEQDADEGGNTIEITFKNSEELSG